jgi:hypothetical protein
VAAQDDRNQVGVTVRAISVLVGPGYDYSAEVDLLPGYVRYLIDRLGLNWHLSIEVTEGAAGEAGASLACAPLRKRGVLVLTQEFFTAGDEERRYLLVYALVQAHVAPVRQCVESLLASVLPGLLYPPFRRAHDDQLEAAADGLARPVARLLPTMTQWASRP